MAGFSANRKTNNEISTETGYSRAGQGGKRHRFGMKRKANDTQRPKALGAGGGNPFGATGPGPAESQDPDAGLDSALDPGLDSTLNPGLSPSGIGGDEGMGGMIPHHAHPIAVHIHLSPSDHSAFKSMARKPRK